MVKRPYVIVVLTDQQRWDTVGAHGNPMNLTPNFDRLAKTGTFEELFTANPSADRHAPRFRRVDFPHVDGLLS